jgi:DNA (cytosine-5)-methyltransferase 1
VPNWLTEDRKPASIGGKGAQNTCSADQFGAQWVVSARSQTRTDGSSWEQMGDVSVSQGYSFIDLFSGAGGMTLGFTRAGATPVFAVEFDVAAAETYRRNFGNHVFAGDIAGVEAFPAADIIVGGPPCQGFSLLGAQDPNDPRNALWRHYLRAVESVSPSCFVMENVPPLLESSHYAQFKSAVETLGYSVTESVLDASLYGVPQRRKRAFVIGSLVGPLSAPAPTQERRTVRDVISDLPLEPDGVNWHIGRNPTQLSLARYAAVPEGGNHYDLPYELKPDCWKRKTSGMTDVFGRAYWDRPSCTIRTEFFKPEKGRYLHPVADRPLTHREAARIQTFPDDFEFFGSKIAVARQIGNAVPVDLARQVAAHVIAQLRAARVKPRPAAPESIEAPATRKAV